MLNDDAAPVGPSITGISGRSRMTGRIGRSGMGAARSRDDDGPAEFVQASREVMTAM